MKPNWKIMQGDVREQLTLIPEKSIQCVVTSPPYFGLRDYGLPPSIWDGDKNCEHEWNGSVDVSKDGGRGSLQNTNKGSFFSSTSSFCNKCGAWKGCLGLEPTPEMYVENMVEVFRGVWKVLRDDGVVWLNLGDSFAQSGGSGSSKEYQERHKQFGKVIKSGTIQTPRTAPAGYKPKDLMMIPFLVARALQQDGWYLRSVIPWLKNSVMPESVIDRPSSAIEYFFLLSKNQKYFYDIEATRMGGSIPAGTKAAKGSRERAMQIGVNARPPEYKTYGGTRNRRNSDWFMDSIKDILKGTSGTLLHDENDTPTAVFCNPQPYPGAHFATFSPRLITPMILAGTSPRACEKCGSPWKRVMKEYELSKPRKARCNMIGVIPGRDKSSRMNSVDMEAIPKETIDWKPTCKCENEGTGRCIVLDPFAGSGTTLEAAVKQGRDSIGIELSKEYCKLIKKRMKKFKLSLF